jgi:hypothetical protein
MKQARRWVPAGLFHVVATATYIRALGTYVRVRGCEQGFASRSRLRLDQRPNPAQPVAAIIAGIGQGQDIACEIPIIRQGGRRRLGLTR